MSRKLSTKTQVIPARIETGTFRLFRRCACRSKPALLKELDQMVREKGYRNRSLAISDMVRDHLVEHHQEMADSEVAGTITLVYGHHRPHVQETLTDLQHQQVATIISSLHVHLDHENCLEVLVVRGRASVVRNVAEHLIAVRGVKHGKLMLTTTGKDLPE